MAKRSCLSDHSPRVSKRDSDRCNVDALLESLFAESAFINASFDDLVESRSTDSDQNDFIQRVFHLGSVLIDASTRSARNRASGHNAFIWPLPSDLTIKVFSRLDTPSVCSAAASCSFFQNCTTDPLCYTNIDLTTKALKVNDDVVSTMIQRAGNVFRNLGKEGGANSLEVMILSECIDLDKVEVKKFMKALLAGKFKRLRHLDISNWDGLAYKGDIMDRRYVSSP